MIDLNEHFRAVAYQRNVVLDKIEAGAHPTSIDEDIQALTSLVKRVSLSHYYIRMHKEILAEMAYRLGKDSEFVRAAREWNDMSLRQRRTFIARFVDMQARVQREISGLTVHGPAHVYVDDRLNTLASARCFLDDENGSNDTLFSKGAYLDRCPFSEAIHTAAHEQTHIFHAWLARNFKAGRVSPSDPIYRDCETIFEAYHTHAYINSQLMEPYKAQFEEKDAEQAGYAMEDCARKAMHASKPWASYGLAAAGMLAGGALILNALNTREPSWQP